MTSFERKLCRALLRYGEHRSRCIDNQRRKVTEDCICGYRDLLEEVTHSLARDANGQTF